MKVLSRFSLLLSVVLYAGIAFSGAAERGALRVGTARVDVTPPVNPAAPPSGKYDHERLYVRAIVLDNGLTRAALIGADTAHFNEEIWAAASKQIAAELQCPSEHIIMSPTHSHSSIPAGEPSSGNLGLANDVAVKAMIQAVRQAKAALQPAQVGFGAGFSYLNVNRDALSEETHTWTQAANLNGASDKTVAVVAFTKPSGEPIAAYVNYAMHPVNGYVVGITSSDFPGATSRYVEKAFDDRMVMVFTQGAAGDQNPLYLRPSTNAIASIAGVKTAGYDIVRESVEAPVRERKGTLAKPDPKAVDNLERMIESEGQLLGEEVIRVMTKTKKLSGNIAIWGAQRTLSCPGRQRAGNAARSEGQTMTFMDAGPVDIRLGMLGIGDIALTTVNAEVYSLIA
jgi:neutral ceramidase